MINLPIEIKKYIFEFDDTGNEYFQSLFTTQILPQLIQVLFFRFIKKLKSVIIKDPHKHLQSIGQKYVNTFVRYCPLPLRNKCNLIVTNGMISYNDRDDMYKLINYMVFILNIFNKGGNIHLYSKLIHLQNYRLIADLFYCTCVN